MTKIYRLHFGLYLPIGERTTTTNGMRIFMRNILKICIFMSVCKLAQSSMEM